QAVAELREGPPDDDSDSRIVPPRKVFLFRVVMSLAIATLWPRFLLFALRQSPDHNKLAEQIDMNDATLRTNSAVDSNRTTVTAFALSSTLRARSPSDDGPTSGDALEQSRIPSVRPESDLTDRSS